jgi:outer membrane protein TolC
MRSGFVKVFLAAFAWATCIHASDTLTYAKALDVALRQSPEVVQARLTLEQSQEAYRAIVAGQQLSAALSLTPIGYSNDLQLNNTYNSWNTNRNTQSNADLKLSQPVRLTGGTFSVDGNLGWNDLFTSLFNRESRSFDYHSTIGYSQPILLYNQLRMTLNQQRLTLENNRILYAMKVLSMEHDIAADFYGLYQDQVNFEIAKQQLRDDQQSYDITKNKVILGLSPQSDLYQAEINLAQSQSSLQNNEVIWENAAEAFKQRLGINLDTVILITVDTATGATAIDVNKAVTNGLQKRMELRQAQITLENSQFSLIQTRSSGLVSGSVNGSIGLSGNSTEFQKLFQNPAKSQALSISLVLPLWDFGANRANVNASEIGVRQSRLSLDQEKTTVVLSIRKEYRTIVNLRSQIAISRKSAQNAQFTYDLNLQKYRTGAMSSLDLNQYEIQLTQAKSALANAIVNYKIEMLNMKVLSLWDFDNDKPVIPDLSTIKE